MRADCVCSKCLAKVFTCNGFTSSVMQCFIWRDAWGSFRMDPECKNNRACHNRLSQGNTNGNSLAVGCFQRQLWIMLLLQSRTHCNQVGALGEPQIPDCWEHLCWLTLTLSTGGVFSHVSKRVLLTEEWRLTTAIELYKWVFYNEATNVQPASGIADHSQSLQLL